MAAQWATHAVDEIRDTGLGTIFENDEKTTFRRFVLVFSKRKAKRQDSGSSFWFENEIVDVVLSLFNKTNDEKMALRHLLYFHLLYDHLL